MKYTFYFDESFHDRKIKLNKTGVLNTMVPNGLDSYIGVFWGCDNERIIPTTDRISIFEKRYKERFGLIEEQELKSQIISKKNYIYGIRSFNNNSYDFYWDLFSLIKDVEPILQIEIISKTEFVIRQLIRNMIVDRRIRISEKSMIYSLTKFINVYHTKELLESLFNIHDEKTSYRFRKVLLRHLKCVLSVTKNIKRKQREYTALKQLYDIVYNSKIMYCSGSEFLFSYDPNFNGLSKLLQELKIDNNDVSIIIDNEEKTFQTAKEFDFYSVAQVESKDCIQVRLSDWISGFIGRMIYALQNDEKMLEDSIICIEDIIKNDLSTKRILSKEWFIISQKEFDLYILLCNSLIIGHEHYWTVMTTTNCDQTVMFYALLRYFASYESFEQYAKVDPSRHSEYYNSRVIRELEDYYRRFEYEYF